MEKKTIRSGAPFLLAGLGVRKVDQLDGLFFGSIVIVDKLIKLFLR